MHRTLILAVAVVGCTYQEPVIPDEDDGSNPPPPIEHTCPTDTSLRLCVQFDGALSPTVADAMSHTVQASAVQPMTHDSEPAAHVDTTSSLYIAASDAGDLDVANLTIEMWISPDMTPMPTKTYWMLDNNTQYGMEYLPGGQVRCVIHDQIVDSLAAVPTHGWTHVACTYDQDKLKVAIGGAIDNCKDLSDPIPTGGNDGVAIGANLGAGPMLNDRFVGGLDNVRVYDAALPPDRLCTIAGGSGCNTSCPD